MGRDWKSGDAVQKSGETGGKNTMGPRTAPSRPPGARKTATAATAAQAVVLIVLPRCEGRFGVEGTGGIAWIRAAALEAWMSWAFFNTATPTACLVPVSAIVVDA